MKIINLELSNAFRRMKFREGTATAMARKLGLSKGHIGRILHGTTQYLSDETWARIAPIITPYIRQDGPTSSPVTQTNTGNVAGVNNGQMYADCLSAVIDRILAADELTAEEKIKVLKIIQRKGEK